MEDLDPSVPARPGDTAMPGWVRRAMAWFFGGVILLWLGRGLISALSSFLILMLVAIFLAFAVEPGVNRLEQLGVRRGVGTMGIFVLLISVGALFSFLIGQVMTRQINDLVSDAPQIIGAAEDWLQDNVSASISLETLQERFLESGGLGERLSDLAGGVVGFGTSLVNLLFNAFTVLLFAFYLIAEGPRFRRTVCSFLPTARQRQVLNVWDLGVQKTGGYLSSRAVLAVISTVVHWVAFALIGVPSPLPLALWMGSVSQIIPVVGLYIAAAVPLLIAVIDNPINAVWVGLVVLIYQQIENYVIQPRVTAQTMEIHPAVAFGSVLVGSALLGPVGALLALPASATIQGFLSTVIERHSIDEEAIEESRVSRGFDRTNGAESATAELPENPAADA